MKRSTMEARAMLPAEGHAYVKVDAELLLDLIDATGWVQGFYYEVVEHPDPDAAAFLATEAVIIHERALLAIDGWVPEILEVQP